MATRKLKNTTISDIYLTDFGNQFVEAAGGVDNIITLVNEEATLKSSEQVFDLVASGDLIVLDANDIDIASSIDGWNWLVAESKEPPKTKDGDWHIVQENFAHVTGNETINWTIEKLLGPRTTYSERMTVPSDRKITINFLEGGSAEVPTHIKLEWFRHTGNNEFIRINPEIRVHEYYSMKLASVASIGDTVLSIDDMQGALATVDFEENYVHGFKDGAADTVYHKVTAIDNTNKTFC